MINGEIFYNSKYKCESFGKLQYNELVDKEWIIPFSNGCFGLSDKFIYLMDTFDKIILKWAKEDNAREYIYPDFILRSHLDQCNYISQFHNLCFFPSTSEVSDYNKNDMIISDYVNNPSVCMHCYIQYKNSIIDINNPKVITVKGKCKRNEPKKYNTLERLLDFTMREIVFIGSEKYVLQKRKEYMERTIKLIDVLKLEGNIKLSNDPFFKREDEKKSEFQKKFKLKYELNLKNNDSNNEIAVASFNYHNIHFSKAFGLYSADNSRLCTGCIAYGLERLVYGFITQVSVENSRDLLERCINTL